MRPALGSHDYFQIAEGNHELGLVRGQTDSRRDGQGHPTNRFQRQFQRFLPDFFGLTNDFSTPTPKVCSPAIATFGKRTDPELARLFGKLRVCPIRRKGGSCLLGKNRRPDAYYQPARHRRAAPAGILHTYALTRAEMGDGMH